MQLLIHEPGIAAIALTCLAFFVAPWIVFGGIATAATTSAGLFFLLRKHTTDENAKATSFFFGITTILILWHYLLCEMSQFH